MDQFILLVIILTCELTSSITIDHDNSYVTHIFVSDSDGHIFVNTIQHDNGGPYFIENHDTGVKVEYLLPIETTKEDSILSEIRRISGDGKHVKFSYSTDKKETREEEFEIDDSDKIKVKGSFSYVDPNGNNYVQGYEADENGYRTKVSFGTKIKYVHSKKPSGISQLSGTGQVVPQVETHGSGEKKIDGTLLCSLGGGACAK